MKTIPAGIVILELGSSLSDERRRSFFISLDVIEGNENGPIPRVFVVGSRTVLASELVL